ncbi:MAG: ABC transporter ATP-binding protein [Phycisphaerales bacterium]|nr:ABC transporter ATP-binding protein [Phycisphaerales bacterium]
MSEAKVQVERLTKRFRMYARPAARLAEWLSFGAVTRHTLFTALEDVSFSMKSGEFFGVIGPNGSGKSTLLKILTRVMFPTSGSFRIEGRVTSLLELGTGFSPELSGRANIAKSARLLGFDEAYVRTRQEEMIAFADIHAYIDQPIKFYSSGMLVRLAFAIFAHVEPDVFIIDEALSVGDVYFAQKCFQRIDQMRARGCTVLFVSHDLGAIRKYCDQALYLHHGRPRFLGDARAATDVYLEAMSPGGAARNLAPREAAADVGGAAVAPGSAAPGATGSAAMLERCTAMRSELPARLADVFDESALARVAAFVGGRIGTGAVEIVAVRVSAADGAPREHFGRDERFVVDVLARVRDNVERATVSLQVTNRLGVVVWGTNQHLLQRRTIRLRAGTWSHARFVVGPGLGVDEHTLDVGFGDATGEGHVFDRLTAVARVQVLAEGAADFVGAARLPCECDVSAYEPRPAAAALSAASSAPNR